MRPSMDLDDLVLNWVRRRVPDLGFKGAVSDIRIHNTMEGAMTVTVILKDPLGHIFSEAAGRIRESNRRRFKKKPEKVDEGWENIDAPGQIGRAVDLTLDGVVFRLTAIDYDDMEQELALTFEHRTIYWLRRKGGKYGHPRHASRADVTRAQFIYSLLREIEAEKIPFVCPEMYKTQRIASATRDESDRSDSQTFRSQKGLMIQGVEATREQKRNMEIVIDTARDFSGSSTRSILAAIVAVIQESWCKNLSGGDRDSRGILQVRDSTAATIHLDNRDIGACVEWFMKKGFWGKGGAVDLADAHPNKNPGWIAQQVQGSGVPDAYAKWEPEAEDWLKAATGLELTSGGGTYRKSYQYKRDKDEVSWDCMQRLAGDVNWRCFMVGRAMYYMSEQQLYQRRVRYHVKPGDPTVINLSYNMDWGKPVQEATLQVNLDRWGAPPGCVVMIEGYGPADGRWLVRDIDRGWFDSDAEVTLVQPTPATPEPASEIVQRDVQSAQDDVSGLYDACKKISQAGGPYVYGGGHGPKLSSLHSGQGLDCSSSTSLALYRAGFWDDKYDTARVSGDFENWGRRGRGDLFTVCYSNSHVYIRFESGAGVDAERFDTSPWGDSHGSGPRLRTTYGRKDDAGMKLRHWPEM